MKRRELIVGMISMGFSPFLRANADVLDTQVKRLRPWYPDHPAVKQFDIDKPGKYILTEDQIQRSLFAFWDGMRSGIGGDMVNINCGSVELDLQGHTLGADSEMGGVSLSVQGNLGFAKRFPKDFAPASLDNRFVTLRNGTIDLARGQYTHRGVNFSDKWDTRLTKGRQGYYGTVPEKIEYIRNEYRFEDLKVLANDVAMAVEGSYTVIRNCVVESAGIAAVFIAGNNVIIENCEIRLRKPLGKNADRPHAAIVLRDGSNAVIRNNWIRVDYDEDSKAELHCILVRDGATDVLVEGNTFINIKGEPVTLTEGAQAIVRDNKAEKTWF